MAISGKGWQNRLLVTTPLEKRGGLLRVCSLGEKGVRGPCVCSHPTEPPAKCSAGVMYCLRERFITLTKPRQTLKFILWRLCVVSSAFHPHHYDGLGFKGQTWCITADHECSLMSLCSPTCSCFCLCNLHPFENSKSCLWNFTIYPFSSRQLAVLGAAFNRNSP